MRHIHLPSDPTTLDEEELLEILGKELWEPFKQDLLKAIAEANAEGEQGRANEKDPEAKEALEVGFHDKDPASQDIPTHYDHNFPTKAFLELIAQSPPLVGEFIATPISPTTYLVLLPTTQGNKIHYLRSRPPS